MQSPHENCLCRRNVGHDRRPCISGCVLDHVLRFPDETMLLNRIIHPPISRYNLAACSNINSHRRINRRKQTIALVFFFPLTVFRHLPTGDLLFADHEIPQVLANVSFALGSEPSDTIISIMILASNPVVARIQLSCCSDKWSLV